MLTNKLYGTSPVFAHSPGNPARSPLWREMNRLATSCRVQTKLPPEFSIVTFNNGAQTGFNNKRLGLLEECLDKAEVPYTVLGRGEENWANKFKIEMLKVHLDNTSHEYVIVADSADVFLVGRLEEIPSKFEAFNCEAVFNCEKSLWPHDLERSILEFEQEQHPSKFFNAGLWVAKREFAQELVEFCSKVIPVTEHINSEQARYKYAYRQFYPRLKVDYECSMFQDLHKTGYEEISLIKLFC